jgi:histone deacetylase 1/2
LPFSLSQHVTTAPLELIYSDVWGPAQTSVSGHNYYVSFVDAYSHFTWLYLIKHKIFLQFQSHVERLLKHKIVHVQSEWGGEYINLDAFFQKIDISHRVSCPHTHQQNGCAERKRRHIIEQALVCLHMPMFHFDTGVMLSLLLVSSLITCLLVLLICRLPLSACLVRFLTTPSLRFLAARVSPILDPITRVN